MTQDVSRQAPAFNDPRNITVGNARVILARPGLGETVRVHRPLA